MLSAAVLVEAPRVVLVFAPGAGGSTTRDMLRVHAACEARGVSVWRCDAHPLGEGEKRWATTNAAHEGNASHVLAVASRAAATHPSVPVVLCGASFGCRVLAELLRSRREALPSFVAHGLICCGYPLHRPGAPEGADPKRARHLLELPPSCHVAFVQGSHDEFLGPRGIAALRDVTSTMTCTTSLVEVEHGVHTLPGAKALKAAGKTQEQVDAVVIDAIISSAFDIANIQMGD